jgi:hypothetical protein
MATTADGFSFLCDRIEAMSHSDKSSSEEGEVYSRRGGTRIDASGASKATKKTNAERVKGSFVGTGQPTLGFGKEKKKGPSLTGSRKTNAAKAVTAKVGSEAAAKASEEKTVG